MLKSYEWVGGWWVAWSNLVSAQGPLVLGLGQKGLGPGLDNYHKCACLPVKREPKPFKLKLTIENLLCMV